jgi:ribosomal protein S21
MKNYKRPSRTPHKANAKPFRKFITVTAEECQNNPEKMLRRFTKKVKSEGLMEEIRERAYFKKPSELRREEKRERKRTIQKVNKQRSELIKPRASKRNSFRNRR